MCSVIQLDFSGADRTSAFETALDQALERHALLRSHIRPPNATCRVGCPPQSSCPGLTGASWTTPIQLREASASTWPRYGLAVLGAARSRPFASQFSSPPCLYGRYGRLSFPGRCVGGICSVDVRGAATVAGLSASWSRCCCATDVARWLGSLIMIIPCPDSFAMG